jgi:hypothetical protein
MGADSSNRFYVDAREAWLSWMRSALIGPRGGAEEEVDRSPLELYSAGILEPADSAEATPLDSEDSDLARSSATEPDTLLPQVDSDAETSNSASFLPSASIGLSFLATPNTKIEVLVESGVYSLVKKGPSKGSATTRQASGETERVEEPPTVDEDDEPAPVGGRRWVRETVASKPGEFVFSPPALPGTMRYTALQGRAEICTRWRQHGDNWLLTVSLVNRNNKPSGGAHFGAELAELCMYQTSLKCAALQGRILPYPQLDGLSLSQEEEELELQYRDRNVFAIGHGVAADWTLDGNEDVSEIRAVFVPDVEVPLVTTENFELPQEALDIKNLERCEEAPDEVIGHLRVLVEHYANWVDDMSAFEAFPATQQGAAKRISERQCRAVERLRRGCALLENDPMVRRAFSLAQRAMRDQMLHVRQAQDPKQRVPADFPFRWRPFQIAFVLLALESVVDPESEDRNCVDLLWFPTGGGKTEAYLGLIAVLILYRRMRWPGSGGGTSVIMRYTLRLLTAQQFQRATALICALELIRKESPGEFGDEPITGGLWVGGASTPNRNNEALEILGRLQQGQPAQGSLFLEQCPWCGTRLIPSPLHANENSSVGVRAVGTGIQFFCTRQACDFHGGLPLHVVDEHLYEHPPTLLLATVDKFARLAWEERATGFLGGHGQRPPEIIIQDELHLIAGPLGSFSGIYEAALDTVLQYKGLCPKYIASTATIRHAAEQTRVLYGREMAVFPPPGHSCDDSFFARTNRDRPGRLYVGFCGDNPVLSWRDNLARAAGAALAAPITNAWTEELRDAWWTLVVYHGSLKGVGESHRLAVHEIPEVLGQLCVAAEPLEEKDAPGPGERTLAGSQVLELTGRVDADGIQDVLRRLQKSFHDPDSVSLALCTNMLSVGIDISRLALMIVNGQPLTTAEYIQASSRVGRDVVPGIVLTHYNRRRARDLSHFENFRPYHDSFYRFVEPTSVTPFSAPARYRALHAALVILLRHGVEDLLQNDGAFRMQPSDGSVQKAVDMLVRRCAEAAGPDHPNTAQEVEEQLQRLLGEWASHKQNNLSYHSRERQLPGLLRNVYEHPDKGLWETMQSMRSVDRVSELKVHRPYSIERAVPNGQG